MCFPNATRWFKYLTYMISFNLECNPMRGSIIVEFHRTAEKTRLKEVKLLAQDHIAKERTRTQVLDKWALKAEIFNPQAVLPLIPCYNHMYCVLLWQRKGDARQKD